MIIFSFVTQLNELEDYVTFSKRCNWQSKVQNLKARCKSRTKTDWPVSNILPNFILLLRGGYKFRNTKLSLSMKNLRYDKAYVRRHKVLHRHGWNTEKEQTMSTGQHRPKDSVFQPRNFHFWEARVWLWKSPARLERSCYLHSTSQRHAWRADPQCPCSHWRWAATHESGRSTSHAWECLPGLGPRTPCATWSCANQIPWQYSSSFYQITWQQSSSSSAFNSCVTVWDLWLLSYRQ